MQTEEIQKVFTWVRIVLIVLAVFLVVITLGTLKDLRKANLEYNSISVTGEGRAVSIADIATFSLSVSADAKTVSAAQDQVTKKMDAILAGLENLGIEKKDIKTTGYQVYPKYKTETVVCSPSYCPPTKQIPDGYTVTHDISVKVRKTEDAGKAFAVAGDNGSTNVSGITLTFDDPEKVLDEARAEAIADAKERAKSLARELDVKLVRVVSYYDNTDGGIRPYYAEGLGGDMVKTASPAPTIPVGENEVKINVTVVYEIR